MLRLLYMIGAWGTTQYGKRIAKQRGKRLNEAEGRCSLGLRSNRDALAQLGQRKSILASRDDTQV
jgi:hypothetical protein